MSLSMPLLISQILIWIVLIAEAALIFALMRQIGVLYERIAPAGALSTNKKLRTGDAAPRLNLPTLQPQTNISVGDNRPDGRSLLLFFVSPNCPVCKTLLPVVRAIERAERDWLDVVYASDGPIDEQRSFVSRHRLPPDRYVLSQQLGIAFGVGQLPYAVLIDEAGRLAAFGLVNTREHIESLFEAKAHSVASLQEFLGQTRRAAEPSRTEYKQPEAQHVSH